ncbi:MAG: aldo/keto reductase [Gammaproteobacteria bacterium]
MKYKPLASSDLKVSEICLGTMTWGSQNSEAEAHEQLAWAVDHGINFIDTAEMYPVPPGPQWQGRTETYIGTWLKHQARDQLIVASKVAGPGRRDWMRGGETSLTKKNIAWALEDSLKRLQTHYLDLYQIHWPERNVPMFGIWQFNPAGEKPGASILEQIEAMASHIQAGKIRYYGLSNETAWGLCEFTRVARAHGLPAPVSVQNSYSLVSRMFDGDLAEASYRLNISLLAYSPLAMGVLSGKYLRGAQPEGRRLSRFTTFGERYRRPRVVEAVAEYVQLADRHNLSPVALALAFVKSRWFVASTIVGATSVAQLEEQYRAWFEVTLTPQALADIEAVNLAYFSPSAV